LFPLPPRRRIITQAYLDLGACQYGLLDREQHVSDHFSRVQIVEEKRKERENSQGGEREHNNRDNHNELRHVPVMKKIGEKKN
jgi:hypothetical protein